MYQNKRIRFYIFSLDIKEVCEMARKPQKTKVEVSKQVKDQKEQKSYYI